MSKKNNWRQLYAKAEAAGAEAGIAKKPAPMRLTDGREEFVVADGPCGFAWVTVRPGTSSFARWLVKNDYASKAYSGGVSIWVSAYNQSIEKKYAHAAAMAEVLRDSGIKAYADSRMD